MLAGDDSWALAPRLREDTLREGDDLTAAGLHVRDDPPRCRRGIVGLCYRPSNDQVIGAARDSLRGGRVSLVIVRRAARFAIGSESLTAVNIASVRSDEVSPVLEDSDIVIPCRIKPRRSRALARRRSRTGSRGSCAAHGAGCHAIARGRWL